MIENLKEKTGKTLEEWKEIIKPKNFQKHGEIITFLKQEHGFSHGYANLVALKAREADAGSSDDVTLVNEQYKGKEHLHPIYNQIIEKVKSFGSDVKIAPKKAYVSLVRNKQFALIQPSTKSRMDIGINIKGKEPKGALEKSGSWNSMVSHRVRIENADQINERLIDWLREAYDNA